MSLLEISNSSIKEMLKKIFFAIVLFLSLAINSFGSSNDDVLLLVHEREITRDEFLYHLRKNYQEINQQNVDEFLDEFIIFHLKIAQARDERLHHNIGFINELAEYRLILAAPYLIDKEKQQELTELKKEWDFEENQKALNKICKFADERIYKGNWIPDSNLRFEEVLFTIDGKSVLQSNFIDYMQNFETTDRSLTIKEYIDSLYEKFVDERLIQYENLKLPEKYPEFRFQYEEYRDAMLLLQITKQKVWLKAENKNPDEVENVVQSDYQNFLMKEWIGELRAKYKVQINKEVLMSIKRQL